jgi:hypothetical protein
VRRRFALAAGAALAGIAGACRPPAAEPWPGALVVAGDSTFWIARDSSRFQVRRSPILLALHDGRFYELYVTDDDRSFYDAVIVGQRIYRRDLVSGDSATVFEDDTVASLAARYAAAHPRARRLLPDEEEADHPSFVFATETEIIDVAGPFVTFEVHVDQERGGGGREGSGSHEVRRAVADLRSGRVVSLGDLAADSAVQRLLQEGRRAARAAFDSVRRSTDERARVASELLPDFAFTPSSFSLLATDRGPAIAFFVPGRGERAGGYALTLPPLDLPRADWWSEVQRTLPAERRGNDDVWREHGLELIARYDASDEAPVLVVRSAAGKEQIATSVSAPVQRIYWLDRARADSVTIQALARAFNQATMYDGPARSAAVPGPPGGVSIAVNR